MEELQARVSSVIEKSDWLGHAEETVGRLAHRADEAMADLERRINGFDTRKQAIEQALVVACSQQRTDAGAGRGNRRLVGTTGGRNNDSTRTARHTFRRTEAHDRARAGRGARRKRQGDGADRGNGQPAGTTSLRNDGRSSNGASTTSMCGSRTSSRRWSRRAPRATWRWIAATATVGRLAERAAETTDHLSTARQLTSMRRSKRLSSRSSRRSPDLTEDLERAVRNGRPAGTTGRHDDRPVRAVH